MLCQFSKLRDPGQFPALVQKLREVGATSNRTEYKRILQQLQRNDNPEQAIRAIRDLLIKKNGSQANCWSTMFEELLAYKADNGHCNVPMRYGKLGSWVAQQRHRKKSGDMPLVQEDQLADEGFSWDYVNDQWHRMFEELLAFKAERGHCNVPLSYGKLGNWVFTQRQRLRLDLMPSDQEELLNDEGFRWYKW